MTVLPRSEFDFGLDLVLDGLGRAAGDDGERPKRARSSLMR